jgi:hypothetical protein
MDIKSVFLNGDLKEYVFMTETKGFEVERKGHKVFKLVKDLYNFKQSPPAWYAKVDDYL